MGREVDRQESVAKVCESALSKSSSLHGWHDWSHCCIHPKGTGLQLENRGSSPSLLVPSAPVTLSSLIHCPALQESNRGWKSAGLLKVAAKILTNFCSRNPCRLQAAFSPLPLQLLGNSSFQKHAEVMRWSQINAYTKPYTNMQIIGCIQQPQKPKQQHRLVFA